MKKKILVCIIIFIFNTSIVKGLFSMFPLDMTENELQQNISDIFKQISDINEHCTENGYTNELGELLLKDGVTYKKTRVYINREHYRLTTSILLFLECICDVDLYGGGIPYHGVSPLLSGLNEIYEIYSASPLKDNWGKLYQFYLLYALGENIFDETIYNDKYFEIRNNYGDIPLEEGTTEYDITEVLAYAQRNPDNWFSRYIHLANLTDQGMDLLKGILKCK